MLMHSFVVNSPLFSRAHSTSHFCITLMILLFLTSSYSTNIAAVSMWCSISSCACSQLILLPAKSDTSTATYWKLSWNTRWVARSESLWPGVQTCGTKPSQRSRKANAQLQKALKTRKMYQSMQKACSWDQSIRLEISIRQSPSLSMLKA